MELQLANENQLELVVSNSASPFQELLISQKDLFRSQIDELEDIVLKQCTLTGVNPLSQEMAAGALSIQIGKRPRDLLNPKAIKYMLSVFSIKDTISKKEIREISALFGVTGTQVRQFFTTQKVRVRKLVRLAQEKANRCKDVHDGIPLGSDSNDPMHPAPLDTVAPISMEQGSTCLNQDVVIPTEDQSDKYFVENIFSLMRKEESFSGQVKLMEWIMRIQNASVLSWFLNNGGVMILATWLTQALFEEQTSVLHVILKVLCHLPLEKALPVHMSAILQSVNSLRFYRASDVSNRARILLTRWSKTFARSQALRKTNGTKSAIDTPDEMLLKQSISEVMHNESWHSNVDNLEDSSTRMDENPGIRKLEAQPVKLLTASTDDPNKKLLLGSLSSHRERRKVLLVEQPGQKSTGRTSQITRSTNATQGRPLSADDIQKAKMRAQFIQSKHGRANMTSDISPQVQSESANKIASFQTSMLPSTPKTHVTNEIEEPGKCDDLPLEVANPQSASMENKITSHADEPSQNTSIENKVISHSDEPPQKKCKRIQIPWQTPPEILPNVSWSVGAGEHSKEVEVQRNRIHREPETIYRTTVEIPSDPKEPWDREMDYDDSLTPEIPIEQLPDVSPRETDGTASTSGSSSSKSATGMPEPDLELLAALLKNPQLVFALTSGQAGNMSNEETVRLLDIIKANETKASANLTASSSGKGKLEEKVEVSLPSPTPSSDPVTSSWKPGYVKNPFSQQKIASHDFRGMSRSSAAGPSPENFLATQSRGLPARSMVSEQATTFPQMEQHSIAGNIVQSQTRTATAVGAQQSTTLEQLAQQLLPQVFGPASSSSLHQNAAAYIQLRQQPSASEVYLNTNHASVSRVSQITNSLNAVNLVNATYRQQQAQLQQQAYEPEAPTAHSWWAMQQGGVDPNPRYLSDVNPSVMALVPPGSRENNDLMVDPDFESWSPDNSPRRSHRYMPTAGGWNFHESRMNQVQGYRPERQMPRHSSGYPSSSAYQEQQPGMNDSRWRRDGRR